MSARRSTSPVAEAKNATLLPASTRFRASATATCMLPWKLMAGRVEMWVLVSRPEGDQPISSCWKTTCGPPSAWRSQFFPAEENPIGIVGRGALDLLQAGPQALDRGLHLIRLVPDHDRAFHQREDRSVARPQHRGDQFPARETPRREAAGRGRGCRPRASARAARSASGRDF